ncbi:transposase [Streptomyces sp. NBC_01242]|uniref:transposase n=1 Tax=Streptomyces sp. NBC_01242 TaxID=2903795 RepID=UPI002252BFEB|nr:transposase [Streptomyces sp. NBC_01242]MCX4798829.1 transposase [Streptomyces sp. NBC_01242]
MSKRIGLYPRVRVEGGGSGAVSQAGAVLLVETVRKLGLETAISTALAPWRKPRAVHDPGKVLLDVALATALGGDCHPGAQLRFTDLDGLRLTCFATNTKGGQLADLELRHRRRARCEDRIRNARDTGLRNLPLHDTAQNQIWLEIVSLALDLLAWMPMLALTTETRRWEPKRLRLRLFSAAAHLVTTGRRRWLRFTTRWPWTNEVIQAIDRLNALPSPG